MEVEWAKLNARCHNTPVRFRNGHSVCSFLECFGFGLVLWGTLLLPHWYTRFAPTQGCLVFRLATVQWTSTSLSPGADEAFAWQRGGSV